MPIHLTLFFVRPCHSSSPAATTRNHRAVAVIYLVLKQLSWLLPLVVLLHHWISSCSSRSHHSRTLIMPRCQCSSYVRIRKYNENTFSSHSFGVGEGSWTCCGTWLLSSSFALALLLTCTFRLGLGLVKKRPYLMGTEVHRGVNWSTF